MKLILIHIVLIAAVVFDDSVGEVFVDGRDTPVNRETNILRALGSKLDTYTVRNKRCSGKYDGCHGNSDCCSGLQCKPYILWEDVCMS